MQEQPIRILIADSHEIVREGIAGRLADQCNLHLVGFASDGYSTIKQCRQLSPDILLMDLGLINPSGIDTLQRVRKSQPDIKIVVLSSEATTSEAFMTLSLGASGFMPKQAKGEHFVNNLMTVGMGYACIPMDYLRGFVDLRRNLSRTGNIYGLSPREVEVLEECSAGAKTKEIASKLKISVRTVETHRNAIYRKTATRSADELVMVASQI
ncbi:MAG: response regulator transcription factor [Pseudomonadota bacterium]